MSSVASYQQAVEYIEWSGGVFVQLYLEDTIRKSDLNLGIMAEGQGQRGFAETASAAQRGSNCCGLAALLVKFMIGLRLGVSYSGENKQL
jgi:hypothetical protein